MQKLIITLTLLLTVLVVYALIPRASLSGTLSREGHRVEEHYPTSLPDAPTDEEMEHRLHLWRLEGRLLGRTLGPSPGPSPSVQVTGSPSPEGALEDRLTDAIIRLQPYYRDQRHRARRLAGIIMGPSLEYGINPFLALALAAKESSLLPNRVGSMGEEGYWQIALRGYARRVCSGGCDQTSARCNARTAICYLDHVRRLCGAEDPDDPTVYILAYGMSRCPTERDRMSNTRPVRRTRGYLVDAVGEEEASRIWPI